MSEGGDVGFSVTSRGQEGEERQEEVGSRRRKAHAGTSVEERRW